MKSTYLAGAAFCLALATPALTVERTDVLDNYADMAAAKYADSLAPAQVLQAAVNALVVDASAENFAAAKAAWFAPARPDTAIADYGTGKAAADARLCG